MRSDHTRSKPAQRPALGIWMTLALLCLLPLATACGKNGSNGVVTGGDGPMERNGASRPDTIVIAYPWDMQGVNELLVAATPMHTTLFYFGLFLPLLEEMDNYTKGPPIFAPRLAKTHRFSEDRLSLTLQLEEEAVCSDGPPISAEDVRFTWQAQTHPDVGWAFAEAKSGIKDVEVLGPRSVRFHFHETSPTQLLNINLGVILPKHAWGQLPFSEWRNNGDWFLDNLVVSGPFTLESWVPAQRIILRRNERYFSPGLPKSERVVFQITPELSSQLALLRSGAAHLVEGLPVSEALRLEQDPDFELLSYNFRQFIGLAWNLNLPLFAEKEVRQALTLGIDRQGILDSIYHGYASVNTSPFLTMSWVSNKDIQPWPYDPGRAKELLAAQGWIDRDGDGILDRDGVPFRFEILTAIGNQIRIDILLMVQQQLRRLGIDARSKALEFQSLLSRQNNNDFEATVIGFSYDTSLEMSYFFRTGAFYNWGHYSNPEMDALLDKIAMQEDQMEAKPLFDRLQVIIHEDQPYTFLYEPKRLLGISSQLKDVRPTAISTYFNLEDWYLAEAADE